MVDGVNATLPNIRGTMSGHIIPGTNSVYDIGSAEYKVRHLFTYVYYIGYKKVGTKNIKDARGGGRGYTKNMKDGIKKIYII